MSFPVACLAPVQVLVGDFEELLVWPEMAPALRDAGLGQAAAADALHALRLSVLDRLTLKARAPMPHTPATGTSNE